MAHMTSRAAGTVWRVEKQVGQRVERGEVLALVDAADVGRAKGEFQRAIVQYRLLCTNVARLKPLAADSTISGRQFREAESAFEDAQVRLRTAQQALVNLGLTVRADEFLDRPTVETAERLQFLGLPKALAVSLDAESTTSNLLPLTSPLDGVIVERNVVAGEVVETATQLFSVADVSRMWLTLNVRQDEAKYLALDERVLFQPSDKEGEREIEGRLAWIATSADERTRTVKVRVDLPNDDDHLLANTFGNGRIVLREESRVVVVPTEAIHWDGSCKVVFVRDKHFFEPDSPKFFHVRMVRTGVKLGDTTEVIAGVLPGEVVAAKNSVVLEAQLLKNNLGEGCGCCK
jgi:cobalt-zinc-cadmium efflux system membrane fusion protein